MVSVPSALVYMARFDAVGQDDFPALRRVLWGGEVLPTPVLVEWMRRLPHVAFTNLYGPTETTITSCSYTVPAVPADGSTSIPIGRPCKGEELFVFDTEGRRAAIDEVGEIVIGGIGVSPGYWGDDEQTERAFSDGAYRTGDLGRIDADGLAYFVGRADSQVKSRGYRVELGEVEAALHSLPGVRECAVVAIDSPRFGGAAICAAYALDRPLERRALRDGLGDLLPAYMLPAYWSELDALPRTGNGKVDRAALRDRFSNSPRTIRKAS